MTGLIPEVGKTYVFISGGGAAMTATVISAELAGVGSGFIRNPDRMAEPKYLPTISPGSRPHLRVQNAEGIHLLDTIDGGHKLDASPDITQGPAVRNGYEPYPAISCRPLRTKPVQAL